MYDITTLNTDIFHCIFKKEKGALLSRALFIFLYAK